MQSCGSDSTPPNTNSSSSAPNSSSSNSSSANSSSSLNTEETVIIEEQSQAICFYDGDIESEHNGFSGPGFINANNNTGSNIIYDIHADQSGLYTLVIRYANGGSERNARVKINDGSDGEETIQFLASTWTDWKEISIQLELNEGNNFIEIVSDSSEGLANIDNISLTGTTLSAGGCDGYTSSSSSANQSGEISGANCQSTGSVSVNETIIVGSGQTFDGNCQTFNPTSALGDGSQSESQKPVFRVEAGGTLRNIIIGNNGADGIHIYGNATVDNVTWTDVGEDALTIKSSGTVYVRNISGYNGDDKFFQINAASTLYVENCIIDRAGKALRQNGGTTFKIDVHFDRCNIRNMNEGIFRTDSTVSTALITNSRLRNAGSICIGNWASCDSDNITYE